MGHGTVRVSHADISARKTNEIVLVSCWVSGVSEGTLRRGDSWDRHTGGRVAMFIFHSLIFRILEDVIPSHEDFETLFIEIQLSNACNLIVGSGYRTHGTPTDIFCRSSDSCLGKVRNEGNHYKIDDFILNLLISPWSHGGRWKHFHFPWSPFFFYCFLVLLVSCFWCI